MEGLPDIPTRWYRDPITGKGKWTKSMTFEQWKQVQGLQRNMKRA